MTEMNSKSMNDLTALSEALQAARAALEARGVDEVLQAPSAEALAQAHSQTVRAANQIGLQLVRDRLALGAIAVETEALSLSELVNEVLSSLVGAHQGQIVTHFNASEQALADPDLVRRSLKAVLRSALDQLGADELIEISTHGEGDEIILSFSAPGANLPAAAAPHLLDTRTVQNEQQPPEPIDLERLAVLPLVQAQGGRVWVDPQGVPGAALHLALPAAGADSADRAAASGRTVLIVDDDPDGAFMLQQVLAKGEYETRIVHDGLSGLKQAKQDDIGLILLDVMLPGLDGFEVCRRLRSDPDTADLPIIMISAKSRPEDRDTGLKMGANAYMSKPLRLAEVLDKVGELLGETGQGT